MLTLPEKLLFIIAVVASGFAAYRVALRITRIIRRGQGEVNWSLPRKRLASVLASRLCPGILLPGPSFPRLVGWGLSTICWPTWEGLDAFLPTIFLGSGLLGNLYRLVADLLSVGVLVGMVALIIRRFVVKPATLSTHKDVLVHPKARAGIRRDSAIVSAFILVHVGSRFLGASLQIAAEGADPWQPFASAVAGLFSGLSDTALIVGEHIAYWLALGTILAFIPYFLYSKHIHLFFAPLNFLFKPERKSIGELSRLDFDDESSKRLGDNAV
jgi:hypothetical protein